MVTPVLSLLSSSLFLPLLPKLLMAAYNAGLIPLHCVKVFQKVAALFFYTFRSHLHHRVTSLIINCNINRLGRQASYMTLSNTTNYYSSHPHHFQLKYKRLLQGYFLFQPGVQLQPRTYCVKLFV